MNVHYVLAITSCNRHDLLQQTLESFARSVNPKPRATFIVEDSDREMPAFLRDDIHRWTGQLGKITWLSNGMRRGQVFSLDKLIAALPKDIEQVLFLEDDWYCDKSLDLNPAFEILYKYPKICQVVFRNDWPHTLIDQPPFEGFKVAMPYWRGPWGGWTWNPNLTRVSTVKQFGTYASQAGYVNGLKHEEVFSKRFLEAGFRIAALPYHFHHIGANRSRSIEPLPAAPKILIAVPACFRKDYGKWESGDSPSFNAGNAYRGEAYGTGIHISGENDRIDAVRETWWNDAKAFPNITCKFFYGRPSNGYPREAQSDEVFLDVPDDYEHLPHKTIAICRWAKANGFEFLLKCDDDSFVWIDRLAHEVLGFQGDYGGHLNGRVATGGPGYVLSKRAIEVIADKATGNYHWAEDVTASHFLFHNNIQGINLEGHKSGRKDHWFFADGFDASKLVGNEVCIHAVKPEHMKALYAYTKNV